MRFSIFLDRSEILNSAFSIDNPGFRVYPLGLESLSEAVDRAVVNPLCPLWLVVQPSGDNVEGVHDRSHHQAAAVLGFKAFRL